ncbi:unnamed protein product [Brassica rapa subsp. trilocularis]|uniref:(rape) hypothetical protein n=1 Tax=Brassica napus TaxID=3708 RepID=A0A816T6C7_BRANA|nr:unnamed protein product [Brassica napus]
MVSLKNTDKTAITDFMKEGTFCPLSTTVGRIFL